MPYQFFPFLVNPTLELPFYICWYINIYSVRVYVYKNELLTFYNCIIYCALTILGIAKTIKEASIL